MAAPNAEPAVGTSAEAETDNGREESTAVEVFRGTDDKRTVRGGGATMIPAMR